MVLDAEPEIFNHNLETVRRLTPKVRSRAKYDRSLSVLQKVKERGNGRIFTKSGMMLGLGESEEELFEAMRDLRAAKCDILTLGQYLQPSLCHLPVAEYVAPEKFNEYGEVRWASCTWPAVRWCVVPITQTSFNCRHGINFFRWHTGKTLQA